MLAASLGFFVIVLDTTIVNVALPAIGEDLGADLSELQWVVDAYVVVFAGLMFLPLTALITDVNIAAGR